MRNEYQRTYLTKNPWARHYYSSKVNSGKRKNGRVHTLKVADVKELWFRDKAFLLKSPSIDRINSKLGYVPSNCRFIERSENSRIGRLGMKDKPETHCINGHKFTVITTYIAPDGRRRCRPCRAKRSKVYLDKVRNKKHANS